jgi:hypothetical protein
MKKGKNYLIIVDIFISRKMLNQLSKVKRKFVPQNQENVGQKLRFVNTKCKTIYHHSNVEEPCAAADRKVMSIKHNGRQSQVAESKSILVDGEICLSSETNSKNLIEKDISIMRSEKYFQLVQ